jgi:hypothetical protein
MKYCRFKGDRDRGLGASEELETCKPRTSSVHHTATTILPSSLAALFKFGYTTPLKNASNDFLNPVLVF